MQIFLKTLDGRFISLDVESSDSIENIKAMADVNGLLVFGGKELNDEFSLADYSIVEDSILYDLPEVDGGKKKKRKKKSFTTKKRVPHTRKKEKMKLLKLFKIGKDGSVEPQRKECENCKGCFMAKHKDGRLYCGNCHLTITK
ncbi:Ubiquitin-40S ribosomal protein S27a [Histomonas meleagridis]|uniref:Ubiquitin-40S ribosomal protein S27a n=1 Tax=Histomonas meleagridis TaxID=135588 RepID=UPI0035597BB5|nr:Ubiquitin-40S ribosomal protein S27a [Histomonas meleagridis]KAH0803148.1 Ubiquitin-40S ribosomal protein S27a [Histomonas meleagridis]